MDATRAAEKLDLVASTLRDLQDKGLTRELSKALNRATEELKRDAKDNAGEVLPHRGGLAERVKAAKLATRRRSGRNPGLRITAKGLDQLEAMDRGFVKHPVWGNRDVWVTQEVTPGWFTTPMEDGRVEVARRIDEALDELAAELARRLTVA